jgi:SRSO17 transposase
VKRQYSGTLDKIGNCQDTVSLHAIGELRLRPRRRDQPGAQPTSAAAAGVADPSSGRKAPRHPATTGSPNLGANEPRERLARLARLRWTIELDYRQLKGELGLDHYEGRSYLGFHHHCALVTCAHAFLTLERLDPRAPRPA